MVERGVIFVDLSLAQIAALGTTIAAAVRHRPHGTTSYVVSLIFTFIGAAVFSTIRGHKARIPQEAVIGICYAVASAAAILAMAKSVQETEHLKEMLVGNILTVSWHDVSRRQRSTAPSDYSTMCSGTSFWRSRWIARRRRRQGISVPLWDFLFYASFGFVVTSSVAIAGVLLVFCYLIVPSVGAMLYSERIGPRLAIGWTMGTLVSAIGVICR